jgi:phosphatidate phosphatase PAH1
MAEKEVIRVQKNKSINLTIPELNYLDLKEGDFVVKLKDENKHGKKYIALYNPEEEDAALIEEQKLKTQNMTE